MENNQMSLVFVISNNGYSEHIIDKVKKIGVGGGTILNGIGAFSSTASKLYGIDITPEKEVLLFVIDSKIKDDVLKTIYENSEKDSPSSNIAFSIPVEMASDNLKAQIFKENNSTNN